ncbi:MAG: hypothetical protein H0Z24_03405 [Thermosipho sp. (in: Bacteria)]|nr:hypothetical protein [Thermosipho sp. (in: thermotogales)]
MSGRKKAAIAILILSIIFIFLGLSTVKETEKIVQEIESEKEVTPEKILEKIDKNYETPYQKKYLGQIEEYNIANEQLHKFFRLINEKRFQEAYNMLDEDYKKEFGISLEEFKAKYDYEKEKIFVVNEFINRDNRYILKARIYNFVPADQPDGEETYITRAFTIFAKKSGYSLADIGILNIKQLRVVKEHKDLALLVDKSFALPDGSIWILEIENKSSESVYIQDNLYGFYAVKNGNKYGHSMINSMPYEIGAKSRVKFIVKFQVTHPDSLGVNFTNGEKIEIRVIQ